MYFLQKSKTSLPLPPAEINVFIWTVAWTNRPCYIHEIAVKSDMPIFTAVSKWLLCPLYYYTNSLGFSGFSSVWNSLKHSGLHIKTEYLQCCLNLLIQNLLAAYRFLSQDLWCDLAKWVWSRKFRSFVFWHFLLGYYSSFHLVKTPWKLGNWFSRNSTWSDCKNNEKQRNYLLYLATSLN